MINERTFAPTQAYKLEDPERLKRLPPGLILEAIGIPNGATIADIGAGTGFFAIPMTGVVGETGHVFAVDLQTEMLELLRNKLANAGASINNIEPMHGSAVNTGLASASCDLVFFANIWHELDNHPEVLAEAARILRGPGRIAIVDWSPDVPNPPGPPADHRIAQADVGATLEASGWSIALSARPTEFHYLIVAARPK